MYYNYIYELEAEMKEKKNLPKKGASRKHAEKLQEIGNRRPPQAIIDQINRDLEEKKKVALPPRREIDLEA